MLATTARSREVKSAGDPVATQKFVDSEFTPLVAAYLKAQDDFVRTLEQRREQVRTDAFNRRVQYAITGLVLSVVLLAVGLAMAWQLVRSITLPLMKPTIVMCLVYCVTGSILAFDQFFILTKGGPNNSTMTVVQLIYNFAFDSKKDLGMAAALSLIVLVALVIINSIQMRGMRDNTK